MLEIFNDGWIADRMQQREAVNQGMVSDLDKLLQLAEGFSDDNNTVPPVLEWEALDAVLDDLPDIETRWWQVPGAVELFTPSQSYRPNCAGFAMANAALARAIIQRQSQFAELKLEKFNPFVTWLLSKGGKVWGGQTISKIARYGNEFGNYLASDVGDYTPAKTSFETGGEAGENAKKHQIGLSYYTGDEPVEDLLRALKKGFTAIVGQSNAVQPNTYKDENGVECVRVGGSWSHATAFGGWKNVNGTDYVFWINSHGNIYPSDDGSPAFGGWMDAKTLKEFCASTFLDICFVTYCEAEPDLTLKPTLNPEDS